MEYHQKKAWNVLWYSEHWSVILMQWKFKRKFNKASSSSKMLCAWWDKFLATGSVLILSGDTCKCVSEQVETVCTTLSNSSTKSIRRASLRVGIPKSMIHTSCAAQEISLLRNIFFLRSTNYSLHLQSHDKAKRLEFDMDMFKSTEDDSEFLNGICFSDEATLHTSRKGQST